MAVIISVCICTLNRVDDLYRSVQSVIDQTVPSDHYEIIVVDNGSSDGTKQMVQEKFSTISNLRYVYETKPGLSQARNAGSSDARGDYILFLDDDAIAFPDWIENILTVYRDCSDAWIVGGRVELLWEAQPKDWLHPDLLCFLGKLDLGNKLRPVKPPEHLYGLNFSVKAQVLREIGYFSIKLGRNPANLLSGEEVEIMKRVQQKGGVCYYSPQSVVQHRVDEARLQKTFFIDRSFWQGYSESIQFIIDNQNPRYLQTVFQVSRNLFMLIIRVNAYLLLFPFSDHRNRFRRLCMIFSCLGWLRHEFDHFIRVCGCWKLDPGDR